MLTKAEMVDAGTLPEAVSADADDDKFLACAVAGSARHVVSGDKHLQAVAKYRNVTVLKPRHFVDRYLRSDQSESSEP